MYSYDSDYDKTGQRSVDLPIETSDKMMRERTRARKQREPNPTHRIQYDGSVAAIEQPSGQTIHHQTQISSLPTPKDTAAIASFPSPNMVRSRQNTTATQNKNDDKEVEDVGDFNDVEKALWKEEAKNDSDADTEEMESIDASNTELLLGWRSEQFLKLVASASIPFLFIVVICAVIGSVLSGSSRIPASRSIDSLSGSVPSTIDAPTSFPTSLKPTTSSPSEMPSKEPSAAPSSIPTMEPIVSDDFQVRLYWEQGYFWQETYEEAFWCMECAMCQSFTLNDGWEGECEVPGSTIESCHEGHQIWVRHCQDTRRLFTFEIIKNLGTGDQVRVHDTDLCFSIFENTFLELRLCDKTQPSQLFNPIDDTHKFELRPYDQRDLSMVDANCLSQRHHPKDKEMVGLHQCETNFNHETNYWTAFHR